MNVFAYNSNSQQKINLQENVERLVPQMLLKADKNEGGMGDTWEKMKIRTSNKMKNYGEQEEEGSAIRIYWIPRKPINVLMADAQGRQLIAILSGLTAWLSQWGE